MARLFIRHKPVDCNVSPGLNTPGRFMLRRSVLIEHGIRLDAYLTDCAYVCFADKGEIWAASSFYSNTDTELVRVVCVRMEDQSCVQEMLLADMILS